MKRVKKFVTLALAAMMLVGCGGNTGEEESPDVKIVKVWVHKSEAEDEGKVYSAIADLFNEQEIKTADGTKTIKMKLEFKNSAETLSNAISSEILTGGLPDIVAVDAPNIAAYADAGILTSIDDYLTTETIDSYVSSVIEQSTIDGKIYALSAMDAPTGLYYNKDLLKQVGYTDEDFGSIENPWSWVDVKEAMAKLKEKGLSYQIKLNLGFGGDEGLMYLYSALVYSAGGDFITSEGKTEGALNSEETLAGIRVLEDILRVDTNGDSWYYNGANTDALAAGEVAFEVFGPWGIASIKKNYPEFVNSYDIMPFPVYEDENGNKGSLAAGSGSWGFGVTPNAKDKDAAAKVLAYLTGPEASRLLYESIGTFPTHKSLFDEISDFHTGPLNSLAVILERAATPRPKMVNYPKLSSGYSKIISYIETMHESEEYDLVGFINTQIAQIDR